MSSNDAFDGHGYRPARTAYRFVKREESISLKRCVQDWNCLVDLLRWLKALKVA
jgi:hypothetical protein